MEEPSKLNTTLGATPLGLTIARKQMEALEKEQQQQQRRHHRHHKQIVTTSWTKKSVDKPQKNASWVALVEGATLYGLCLVLPSLIGMIMRLQERHDLWQEFQQQVCERSAWICWHVFGAVLPNDDQLEQPQPLTFTKNFVAPDTYLSDICVIGMLTLTMALFRVLLVHMLVPNNLAPQQMEALVRCKSIHLLSSDYKHSLTPRPEETKNIITLESLKELQKSEGGGLPALPIWPGDDDNDNMSRVNLHPSGLAAATKSEAQRQKDDNHQQQRSAFRRLSENDLGLSIDDTPLQQRPTLNLDANQVGGFLRDCSPLMQDQDNDDDDALMDDSEHDLRQNGLAADMASPSLPLAPTLSTPRHSPTPFLDRPPSIEELGYGDQEEEEGGSRGWKRRSSTASLAAAAAAAVQEEEEDEHSHDDDQHDDDAAATPQEKARPKRLFAAPRYATAVFRLLYCTCSCAMAWYLFRDADFWPRYVGGHGSTTRCWDLSGSLALAKNLDSDFDHRNTVLRRFFLVQASYHLHSGAFHVFSVLLLFFLKVDEDDSSGENGKKKKKKDWVAMLRSLIHPRALLQHSLSLIFLSVSYVFSSLRRLGAIGMFALDMSSWALHLLQTCLNAPTDSILSRPRVIKGVWALLVVPSFLYFRFWVWPVVGYSAMVESEQWLAQLESTLVPGSALWFRRIFLSWMTLWMGFHAIHFKRLVFHPHIQRIMLVGVNSSEEKVNAPKKDD